MPNIAGSKKQQAKDRVRNLISRSLNGVKEIEIADELGIHKRTVNNYLAELASEGLIFKEDNSPLWFNLKPIEMRLKPIPLSPEEAASLYLAARLLTKQQGQRNEAIESGLMKLAEILSSDVGISPQIYDAAKEMIDKRPKHGFDMIFRTIMQAFIYRREIEITYKTSGGYSFSTNFNVYLVEPSAVGQATYIIGFSHLANEIRSYKIERIVSAKLTRTEYQVPSDFKGVKYLQNAWSIMSGEETQKVVLRFSPRVKARVLETTWHQSSDTEDDLNDPAYLIWVVEIANTLDIESWIRGWGRDVEVLEPAELRESIKLHVADQVQTYEISQNAQVDRPQLLQLWGKTVKRSDVYHPAVYHMLDVAHVAQQLLSSRANPRWRRVLGNALNVDPNSLIEWLPWIIALHDIGKLSVPFQVLNETQKARLEGQGFDFGRYQHGEHKLHHTLVGRYTLETWSENKFGKQHPWRTIFLDMVAGHHGEYQSGRSSWTRWQALNEPAQWGEIRQEGITFLRKQLLINEPVAWPTPANLSAAIVLVNGFCILCDWLGSDETYFTPKPLMAPADYSEHSRAQARKRVEKAGFFAPVLSQAPTEFSDLFEGWAPRPLQKAIDQIPAEILTKPTLTIIESLTGEGKTEAALTLAHKIGQQMGTDEIYIALPTTATSNAMFKRFQKHLQDRLKLPAGSTLVHGQAFLVEDDLRIEPLENDANEPVMSLEWFAPKKRALLAPFAVGTVDQAELSALNVKHNALRLIGLAGKVVVLDEVHAYDTYMTTIIKRMLEWLSALGTSVILLSATLPLAKRRQLVQAYTGQSADSLAQNEDYPYLLTIGGAGNHQANPQAAQKSRKIELATLDFGEDEAVGKAQWLLEKIENGGTVCWITNIVKRSQAIFKALQELAPADVDLELLHSQFPLNTRQDIETRILDKHGKQKEEQKEEQNDDQRPTKAIVIGTQVLEQSLDLDFDFMVSDLAPIDLLLQRVGRVHRHPGRTNRSPQHPTPRFWVNAPVQPNGALIFGADVFYTEYILAKSWEAVQNKIQKDGLFDLPNDYRPLVEHVYTEEEPAAESPFWCQWDEWKIEQSNLKGAAKWRLTNVPDFEEPFYESQEGEEFIEDEDGSAWLVAQTRYIERETLTVIPLKKLAGNLGCMLYGDKPFSLDTAVDRPDQLALLGHSVKISHKKAVVALKDQEEHTAFKASALLKRCYPLFLQWDETAQLWESVGIEQEILLNPNLGVVFDRNNKL